MAYNKANANLVFYKLKEKLMEALFELQMDASIYISNHSEADHTSYVLALKCLEQLDDWDIITWRTDGVSVNDSEYNLSEKDIKEFAKLFMANVEELAEIDE